MPIEGRIQRRKVLGEAINEYYRAASITEEFRRGGHKSVQAWENDIRAWMDQSNDGPKPFVWTKTPEDPRIPR